MANLIVRNIDNEIVRALKARADNKGISAEAEHRKILESVLIKPKKKSFVEVLLSVPDVGVDADFERLQDDGTDDVFA